MMSGSCSMPLYRVRVLFERDGKTYEMECPERFHRIIDAIQFQGYLQDRYENTTRGTYIGSRAYRTKQ